MAVDDSWVQKVDGLWHHNSCRLVEGLAGCTCTPLTDEQITAMFPPKATDASIEFDSAISDLLGDLRTRIKTGPPTQLRYEQVMAEAARIRQSKVEEYGEDRYQEPSLQMSLVMCYSDVYRKNIRLRQLTDSATKEGPITGRYLATLRETYMDLLNYAAMAVQEIDRFTNNKED